MPDQSNDLPRPKTRCPEELLKQLSEQPVSEVLGVVCPSGAGGGKGRGEQLWTFTVRLAAWRPATELVRITELVVRKSVTEPELNHMRSLFSPYEVVRLRAQVAEQSVFGRPDALLIEMLGGYSADDELNRIAQQLREPVTLDTHDFGRFTLDRRVNWFEASTTWGSDAVRLNLSTDDSANADQLIALARSVWDLQPVWDQRIRDFAVSRLLSLKNETWLEEDEKELNAQQLKERMKLESIVVYPRGQLEFWFNDGDLFWGHSIRVSANFADGPTHAGIEG